MKEFDKLDESIEPKIEKKQKVEQDCIKTGEQI